MAIAYVNQVAPIVANAGVTNTQNVFAPVSSTLNSAAGVASQTAVPSSEQPAFLGLDTMTWLTLLSIGLYIYFSLKGEH